MSRILPVVLAGGAGSRLWPLSTPEHPKPLLDLLGHGALLVTTLQRLAGLAHDPGFVVGSASLAPRLRALLDAHGLRATVVAEPAPRSTAPALLAAAALADDDDVLVVLPADHHVADAAAFVVALNHAVDEARRGHLVLLGVVPTRPEPGFGHIQVRPRRSGPAQAVVAFVEKPDAVRAAAWAADGEHLWNSGIFVVQVGVLRSRAMEKLPAAFDAVDLAVADGQRTPGIFFLGAPFAGAPSVSIDVGLAETWENARVVPLDAGWSDVGTFRALREALPQDADGNAVRGEVTLHRCRRVLAYSTAGPLVVEGLADVAVVQTPLGTRVVPL